MQSQQNARTHELDLKLVADYGYLENSEDNLSKKDFLTDKKVKVINQLASELFENSDKEFHIKK